jgi:glycosyltransferase involved in cell wall biosynthesis
MASGCLIVGSATAPVLEVLEAGRNGFAVDFFDREALVSVIDAVLDHPDRMQDLRDAARATAVREFDLAGRILPQWQRFLGNMIEGKRPRPQPPSAGLATKLRLR